MSYNLLLDTNFNKTCRQWKLTNCEYKDGYLIAKDNVYSIEQRIVLPNPTKLFFSMDYIAFDKNIKKIYVGIQCQDTLHCNLKRAKFNKSVRQSVVYPIDCEEIVVKFIVEAKTKDTKIYINRPMLIDLSEQGKELWSKWILDRTIDYRYGFDYDNLYCQSEITLDNQDFSSPYTTIEKANVGVIATITESDWFNISIPMEKGRWYLVKVDLEQINQFGDVYLQYGEKTSEYVGCGDQLFIHFVCDGNHNVKVHLKNQEQLAYLVNFKRVLAIDMTNKVIEEKDVPHLPFIE